MILRQIVFTHITLVLMFLAPQVLAQSDQPPIANSPQEAAENYPGQTSASFEHMANSPQTQPAQESSAEASSAQSPETASPPTETEEAQLTDAAEPIASEVAEKDNELTEDMTISTESSEMEDRAQEAIVQEAPADIAEDTAQIDMETMEEQSKIEEIPNEIVDLTEGSSAMTGEEESGTAPTQTAPASDPNPYKSLSELEEEAAASGAFTRTGDIDATSQPSTSQGLYIENDFE